MAMHAFAETDAPQFTHTLSGAFSKPERVDTTVDVTCPECGHRLGSSSDAGAARRLVSWHRGSCTAALDIFETQESNEWASRPHTDPFCAMRCSSGHRHSQCGCSCDHRSGCSE